MNDIPREAREAAVPPLPMLVAERFIRDALMRNDDLGVGASWLEPHGHPLRFAIRALDAPRVSQPMRSFDGFEHPHDPDLTAVRHAIADPIRSAHAHIDTRADTGHALWPPPFHELFGPRPRIEQPLRCRADRVSHDQGDHGRST